MGKSFRFVSGFRAAASAVRAFGRDRKGATAIEYAMIASGISVVIVGAALTLGETLRVDIYGKIVAAFG